MACHGDGNGKFNRRSCRAVYKMPSCLTSGLYSVKLRTCDTEQDTHQVLYSRVSVVGNDDYSGGVTDGFTTSFAFASDGLLFAASPQVPTQILAFPLAVLVVDVFLIAANRAFRPPA